MATASDSHSPPPERSVVETDTAGSQLQTASDVKVRGVIVGEVLDFEPTGDGADVTLGIYPSQLDSIPADVTGSIVPKTLFGERYVSLEIPPNPTQRRLQGGDLIGQDRSQNAVETEQVLLVDEPRRHRLDRRMGERLRHVVQRREHDHRQEGVDGQQQ